MIDGNDSKICYSLAVETFISYGISPGRGSKQHRQHGWSDHCLGQPVCQELREDRRREDAVQVVEGWLVFTES